MVTARERLSIATTDHHAISFPGMPTDAVVGKSWRHRTGIQPGNREVLHSRGAGADRVMPYWSAGVQPERLGSTLAPVAMTEQGAEF